MQINKKTKGSQKWLLIRVYEGFFKGEIEGETKQ